MTVIQDAPGQTLDDRARVLAHELCRRATETGAQEVSVDADALAIFLAVDEAITTWCVTIETARGVVPAMRRRILRAICATLNSRVRCEIRGWYANTPMLPGDANLWRAAARAARDRAAAEATVATEQNQRA